MPLECVDPAIEFAKLAADPPSPAWWRAVEAVPSAA
jgi:hypothetical protein